MSLLQFGDGHPAGALGRDEAAVAQNLLNMAKVGVVLAELSLESYTQR